MATDQAGDGEALKRYVLSAPTGKVIVIAPMYMHRTTVINALESLLMRLRKEAADARRT